MAEIQDLISEKATDVAGESQLGGGDFGLDPTIWVAIVQAVLQLLDACGKKSEAQALAKRPRVRDRLRLRLAIRSAVHAGGHELEDQAVGGVAEAVLAVGRRTTAAEFRELFREAMTEA